MSIPCLKMFQNIFKQTAFGEKMRPITQSKVIIAIPSYRCEKQIPRVLKGFKDSPELFDRIGSIVVIDNQSPDSTRQAAAAAILEYGLESKAEVVRNSENYGLGGSHKVALRIARERNYDLLAILHGDNQATTTELLDLIRFHDSNPEFAAVLGSRFSWKSRLKGYSKTRIFGNLALNFIYTFLTFRKTCDLGSGLNVFKINSLDPKAFVDFANAFTFNMDLLLYFYSRKLKVYFYPITWSETDQVSNARNLVVGWTALKAVLKWRLGIRNQSPNPSHLTQLESYQYGKV